MTRPRRSDLPLFRPVSSWATGFLLAVACGLGVLCASHVGAQPPSERGTESAKSEKSASNKSVEKESPKRKSNSVVSAERSEKDLLNPLNEELALEFAASHHPQLAALLRQLKDASPKDYRSAIVDVEWSRQRLERTRERSVERYQLELSDWTLDSRIRLLTARLAMGKDPSLVRELEETVRERAEVRLKILHDEKQRLLSRLEKLEGQIAQRESEMDEVVSREIATLLRSASAASDKVANKRSKPDSTKSNDQKPTKKPAQASTRQPVKSKLAQP